MPLPTKPDDLKNVPDASLEPYTRAEIIGLLNAGWRLEWFCTIPPRLVGLGIPPHGTKHDIQELPHAASSGSQSMDTP